MGGSVYRNAGSRGQPLGQPSHYNPDTGRREQGAPEAKKKPKKPGKAKPKDAPAKSGKTKETKPSPKASPTPRSNPVNDRFGNDMAWLDDEFQQDPTLLGQSAGSSVFADPRAIAAQNEALDSIMGIARGGGATAAERARMASARRDQESWLRGQREGDMQDLAERGMAGSGAELLTVGNDRQAAAGRISQADLETEAMLEQRAIDATMAGSQMASGMRGQSSDEGFKRADAADSFAALNQNAINTVEGANTKFKQDAWQRMINNRNEWDAEQLKLGLSTAGDLLGTDQRENAAGFEYAGGLAKTDAAAGNAAQSEHNNAYINPITNGSATAGALKQAVNQGTADAMKQFGEAGDSLMNTIGSTAGGVPGGVGGGSGTTPPKQDDDDFLGGF